MAGKRSYGTGELYEKHGSYYARWRTSDGRKLNRKVGAVRPPGTSDGFTRFAGRADVPEDAGG